jgi:hypothetical protein
MVRLKSGSNENNEEAGNTVNMGTVRIQVERRTDLPGGLPAIWLGEPSGTGRLVRLFLRHDLPDDLAEHFFGMARADSERFARQVA